MLIADRRIPVVGRETVAVRRFRLARLRHDGGVPSVPDPRVGLKRA